MILIDATIKLPNQSAATWAMTAADSHEATVLIRGFLRDCEHVAEPRLHIRVTGDTTAASCRHHPLAPGTIGDPRR